MYVSSSRVPAPHPGAGDGVNRSWTGNLNVLFRNGQYRLHSDAIRSEHRSTMPIRITDDSVLHLQTYLSEGTWGAGKRVPEPERSGWGEEGLRNHSISSKKATFVDLTATHAFSLKVLLLWFSLTREEESVLSSIIARKHTDPLMMSFQSCHGHINHPSVRASHPCRMVSCKAWNAPCCVKWTQIPEAWHARRSWLADGLPGVLQWFRSFPFCDSIFKSLRDMPIKKDAERKLGSAGSSLVAFHGSEPLWTLLIEMEDGTVAETPGRRGHDFHTACLQSGSTRNYLLFFNCLPRRTCPFYLC